ncbi:TetR family transcriptional regulator C-terminal domain-containing protein [Rhizobium sp. KVB221]|uniref:TetR family transcriptional regulator C-terminal domain-containing protein n=1 Tax=Rhizobium setariae TaxID=2801340 RepID=A0A937CQ74_9HYPH|nr:TetR family transcriptional regulator C-terminal domain-containing protein [Rhizobium setariae]MBL0372652.1 TetR family transcriptional regulator C-terminal domain-containing protein [Rhizobium setariae]
MGRRTFHHESEDVRRQDLVGATLDCIAEFGLQGATVRQIAERAGVTPGLIRHYFLSKELMFQAAYREVVNTMFETASKAADEHAADPMFRLKTFVLSNFQAPIIDARMLSLWATFISQIGVDPALAAIHRESYLSYRDTLEQLLADAMAATGRTLSAAEGRPLAIAINGLIDGLWLEGCMAGDLFDAGELGRIALNSVETLTGLALDANN